MADLEQNEAACQSIIYFYFTFRDIEKQSVENAIRSLISQLYHKREDARGPLDSLYATCNNGGNQPGQASLQAAFQSMIAKCDEVWIVLDALDECHADSKHPVYGLLPWIKSLQSLLLNTHLLVTSRPEQDIKSSIETWASNDSIILLQSEVVDDDISSYVRYHVRQMERWRAVPEVRGAIETQLIERADGM